MRGIRARVGPSASSVAANDQAKQKIAELTACCSVAHPAVSTRLPLSLRTSSTADVTAPRG
jgi:hypothetical protein